MTMHPVWRVEHASDRSGPWVSSNRWSALVPGGTSEISTATPTPYTDARLTLARQDHPRWGSYVFGCSRPQDFISYGFPRVWDALRYSGYVLRLYEAQTVLVGDTQCMFDPDGAVVLVEYLSLEDACRDYPTSDPLLPPRTVVPPVEEEEDAAVEWLCSG